MNYYKNTGLAICVLSLALLSSGKCFAEAPVPQSGYMITKDATVVPNDKSLSSKVVLLTIDDGPTKRSSEIMDILEKENIKAIFFVNGMHNNKSPNTIKAEFSKGHEIGNHTWSHRDLRKLSKDKYEKEILKNTDLIKSITGNNPKFFRPPYGMITKEEKEFVKKNGMLFMNWSTSAIDWDKKSHDKKVFVETILRGLKPGAIILIHEHPWTVSALPDLIKAIKARGYTFLDPKEIKG